MDDEIQDRCHADKTVETLMIELEGTLTERLDKAVALVCDEVTDGQIMHFYDIYGKAGIL